MKVTGIECPWCLARIWSRSRHNTRHCPCGYCFIDGGRDYLHAGWGGPDWPEPWAIPAEVEIEVSDA